jgi:opacity protein-like surface antigen
VVKQQGESQMNKFIATLALGVALFAGGVAHASSPLNTDRGGVVLSVNAGSTLTSDSRLTMGASVGYQVNRFLRVEGAYDYGLTQRGNGILLTASVIPQYRIPNSTVTMFGQLGAGAGWNRWGDDTNGTRGVYVLGAGVRTAVSTNVELEARYRYVAPLNVGTGVDNVQMVTVGFNYRF